MDVPVVAAQADGIHLEVMNPGRPLLAITLERAPGDPILDEQADAARATFVEPIAPGSYLIACGGPGTAFDVVDPAGRYTSTELGCPGVGPSGTVGVIDYGLDARGPRGAVLDVARHELRGLRPGDVVERAGYQAGGGSQAVRVVRAGLVVAVLSFEADGHRGWLLTGTSACGDSGVTAEPPG